MGKTFVWREPVPTLRSVLHYARRPYAIGVRYLLAVATAFAILYFFMPRRAMYDWQRSNSHGGRPTAVGEGQRSQYSGAV